MTSAPCKDSALEDNPIDDLDVAAPPWHYNPSAWRQRIPICALAALAFAISAWMALYQWRLIGGVWDPIFGEQTLRVLDSDVSHAMQRWFGIRTRLSVRSLILAT